MLEAYRAGDAAEFNASLQRYQAELHRHPPSDYTAFKVDLESRFNGVSPFYMGMFSYALAFLVAVAAIPVWILIPRLRMPLHWSALSLVVLTLLVHTLALGLRMYISGRPPVTTLYSSAIFIGWAGVIFGVCIRLIFRLGIGNILSGVAGFATLFIAYLLAQDGEAMPSSAAVLDTQFSARPMSLHYTRLRRDFCCRPLAASVFDRRDCVLRLRWAAGPSRIGPSLQPAPAIAAADWLFK